jgi:Zn finger protein HypA/HybF involved in hydrogenase expression
MWSPPLIARLQHSAEEVRCECQACGAHTFAPPNILHIRRCGNCQSIALTPLEPSGPDKFGGQLPLAS